MQVKEMGGEASKFEDDRLDFTFTKTVIVKLDLYGFRDGSPVKAFKIAYF